MIDVQHVLLMQDALLVCYWSLEHLARSVYSTVQVACAVQVDAQFT